jgi:formylglycine-generating enzyme required for sulfatase activity
MKLIRIQASSFEMGSVFGGRRSNEKAIRTVRLRDFWLGETEVTQGQWGAIGEVTRPPSKKDAITL